MTDPKNDIKKVIAQGIWEQKNQEETLKISFILVLLCVSGLMSASPVGLLLSVISGFLAYVGIRYALEGLK